MRPKRSTAGKRRAFHDELSHGEYDKQMEIVDNLNGKRILFILAVVVHPAIPMLTRHCYLCTYLL